MRASFQGSTIFLTCQTEAEEHWADHLFGPRSKKKWKKGRAKFRVKYVGKYATNEDQTGIQIKLEVVKEDE